MSGFSITEVAFTGFRIVRQRPRAVIVWATVQLALSLIGGAAVVTSVGPELMRLRALGGAATQANSAELAALFGRLAPFYGVALILVLVFNPLLYGAMNRAVMRPAEDRFGYFRLGADELRQFALLLLQILVLVGAYFVVALIALAVTVVVAMAAKPAAAAVLALIGVVAVCAALVVAVRLSLASAQTFATGRVNLFGSWALTRGRFWPILGSYVLAGAFAVVVYLLWFVLTFAIVAAIGGIAAVGSIMQPNLGSLAAFFAPVALTQSVLGAVVTALLWPVLLAPPAAIYQQLAAPPARGAAS